VSDKYTTDGLIGCLEVYRTFQRDMFTKEEIDAIIARLRAADALCEAAREHAKHDEEWTCDIMLKAIAEFKEA